MTKPSTAAKRQAARNSSVFTPPSRPKALAAAVSLAVVAPHAMAAWDNQVEAWVRPGTDRSYGGLEGVLPFSQNGNSLTFADLKFKLGQSGTYEGNLGVGHRFLTGGGDWALGFYGAWDHRRSKNGNSFNQIVGGAEARSDKLDFRFNYYWPITDRESLGLGDNYVFEDFSIYQSGIWEEAMKGFDIEAGVLLPISSKWETRAYAAYYNFEGKDIAPKTDGWRVRVEVRPTHNFAIGLSHQRDDMFKDQTSLELRYIFGKDGKSGVRSLRERMTDPWTRDIDIVVSTPQEGDGSRFGEAVPGVDVVHIDSDRGSDTTGDGSFENPYASTAYCLTQKCVDGVSNPAVDVADYNVIRLWEGLSQTDGGYTPINLYNGQMLAGEPVSAAMIVGQFHPGRPGAIDVPWNLDLGNAPVINGASGPAIALTSGNNRIMGVSTVNGGIHSGEFDYYSNFTSGYVSGFVDIRNNDIDASTYYGGTGISLVNYNNSLDVTIGYNQISAAESGIMLSNVADDGGSATMSASIYGNYINVNALSSGKYYGNGATGIALYNMATDGASASMSASIYDNYIDAVNDVGGGAMGVVAMNAGKYYSSASQNISLIGNDIRATGDAAMGVVLANMAAGAGANADQYVYAKYNTVTADGVSSADGVSAINMAKYNASAGQDVFLWSNTISASDSGGLDSATGVIAYNVAGFNSTANQSVDMKYNTVSATSASGNATGVAAVNIAVGSYDDSRYYTTGSGTAVQSLSIYGGTITATGGNDATGVALANLADGGSGGYSGYPIPSYTGLGGNAYATQNVSLDGVTIAASANGNAYGVYAENRASGEFASSAYANQYVSIFNSVSVGDGIAGISATSANGDAYGVKASNEAIAQYYTGNYAQAGQNVYMGNNGISASSSSGNAYGVFARNDSNANSNDDRSDGSQVISLGGYNTISAEAPEGSAYGVMASSNAMGSGASSDAYADQSVTIGDINTISATAKYYATGVSAYNTSGATGLYGNAYATQYLGIGSNNTITAASDNSVYYTTYGYGRAIGVGARNDVSANGENSAEGRQTVVIGDNNSISATAVNSATGISLRNDIEANAQYAFASGGQTVTIGGDWWDGGNTITATATGGNSYAYGIDAHNHVNTYYSDSTADGSQDITIGSYNVITASAGDYPSGIYLHNEVGAGAYGDGSSSTAWGSQSLTMGYSNSVSATATGSNANANGIEIYNEVFADGYYSLSSGTQTATIGNNNSFSGTANGYYAHADAADIENDVEANDDDSGAEGYQNISFGNYNTFTATANGTYGDTHGITVTNDIDANDNYSSAYGSQSLTLGRYASLSATSNGNGTGAYAIALHAKNDVQSDDDDAPATGYQTVTVGTDATFTATASGTYGRATGVHLYNYAYTQQENNNSAIANQSFTLGAGGSITATGNYYANGLYAYNNVYADGGTAQGTQIVDINGSALSPVTITATSASGQAYGLALYNRLESESSDGSAAVQTVNVGNSDITANGYNWSLAVLADNDNHAHDNAETATQTIVIDDSVLRSNIGDAIFARNTVDDYGVYSSTGTGTGTQTLVVTGSSLYGGTSGYASGIEMVNDGYYRSFQNGVIVGNYISSNNDGVAIYNSGGDVQHVTVSANSFSVGGSDTYADGLGNDQLLTVTP